MQLPKDINEYLRAWAPELGERILQTYPPLQGFDDAVSPLTGQLLRKPFPAQTLAMMGVVKRWTEARGAAVIAECGTGKTLISLGAVHVHSDRKPFTALAMVPPQLVEKWAREAFQTLPPSTKSGCAMAASSGKGCALHSRSYASGGRLARHANAGIQSADSRLCSLWGVTAESSVTFGDMRTRLLHAGATKGAL